MSEHAAPSERTANEPERTTSARPEHLTYTEAAKRLGVTPNAVRMRAARGKLASVRINERTLIVWPQPGHLHTPHEPHAQEPAHERTERADERLVARLEAEVSHLRGELAERTEEIRRRDHIIAGLVESMRALPATVEDGSVDVNTAPPRDEAPAEAPEAPHTPWWRRLLGR